MLAVATIRGPHEIATAAHEWAEKHDPYAHTHQPRAIFWGGALLTGVISQTEHDFAKEALGRLWYLPLGAWQ